MKRLAVVFACMNAALALPLRAEQAPSGCDAEHFAQFDAYLDQYGTNPPDRTDIERFIALNHRLCDDIVKKRATEADAGVIYWRELDALVERIQERDLELKRKAGLIESS